MGEPLSDLEAKALRLGAAGVVTLRRPDLAAAVVAHPSDRPVGEIVVFPRARRSPEPVPAPAVYEDPRWADLHSPD